MADKTSPKYYEMSYAHQTGGTSVEYMSDQEHVWDLSVGKKLAKVWPEDMSFKMSPKRPKDINLIDYISNLENVLLISPKFRDFFKSQRLKDLEFLPVKILDHKGRVASKDYSLLNCIRVVDCIDQKKSKFSWDELDEPSMDIDKMVFNPNALGEDDRIIRAKFVPGQIFFREDLTQSILGQGFSGVAFSREIFGDSTVYRRPK